jgi:hypothetical protein
MSLQFRLHPADMPKKSLLRHLQRFVIFDLRRIPFLCSVIMRHFFYLPFLVLLCAGCAGRFSDQVETSLLLQENQRLEHALHVTHAQLQTMKRENAALKGEPLPSASPSSVKGVRRPARLKVQPEDAAPAFETPKIEIPVGIPPSATPPDSLKSSLSLPDAPVESSALVPPMWSPTR